MANEIEICNMALGFLGQKPITNLLNPENRPAELCALYYPTARDGVLESRAWSFAMFRAVRESSQMDEWETAFTFPVDPDWLAVLRVFRNVRSGEASVARDRRPMGDQVQWWLEGDQIIADASKIYVWGIQQITETNRYSKLFVQALAARLAADLAMPITENRNIHTDMWARFEEKLKVASSRDASMGRSEIIQSKNLISSRQGAGLWR